MKLIPVFLLSAITCFCSIVNAQDRVDIYADINSNDSLKKLVTQLTDQLKKASYNNVVVQPASAFRGKGIYISNTQSSAQPVPDALRRAPVESYSIQSNEQAVQIIGNCNLSASHGVFAYLDKIGYRFYFANSDWHITPQRPVLFSKWSTVSTPVMDHRRIWYGYGTGSPIADADYWFWVSANRLGGTMQASFGHSYEEIISRNREAFLQHPEWFYPVAPRGTIPTTDPKFDVSREDLVQFIIKDVEQRIEASLKKGTEDYKMISLGPSDGLGTCDSPECRKLGTITDRVFYLVNRVAKAISKKYPHTYIGCLAYGEYIAPPTKPIEPNVFVGITTAFNNTTLTTEQLVQGWRKMGANVGIYDYFSWYAWDFDIPGQSLASRTDDIVASVKKYEQMGVKAYDAESSIGWVSKGLGYYLAAKQMWDINADINSARDEFFTLSFNSAAGIMRSLWNEWEHNAFTPVRENALAKWIDMEQQAEKLERNNPAVMKRLFQVKSYLHYLFLYRNYVTNRAENTLLPLLNYAWRKLDDGSVGGYPAFWELGNRSGYAKMGFVEDARWKYDNRKISEKDIDEWIKSDRKQLKTGDAVNETKTASSFMNVPNLEKYRKLISDSTMFDNKYWLGNEWVIQIKNKSAANYIDFTGDYIGNKSMTKPIKISIYPFSQNGIPAGQVPLIYYEYTKTMVPEKISLEKLSPGYYTVVIADPVKMFKIDFSSPVNYSLVMRPEQQVNVGSMYYGFLYVPEDTKKFNIMTSPGLVMITPTGRVINYEKEEMQVEVKKGETGLWRLKPMNTKLYVEGIPPYLGVSAKQMLIPQGTK